jgi:hypothetical protein
VHGSGDHFRRVSAFWRQPTLTCAPPNRSYSAVAVGLGGFLAGSVATEQVGTEADCSYTGKQVSSAFFRLAARRTEAAPLQVFPGDVIAASVQLGRNTATITITDLTTDKGYILMRPDSRVDDSAAEWILQAPSYCTSPAACQPLPLADFGTSAFGLVSTTLSTGHVGSLTDRKWSATRISIGLHPHGFGLNDTAAAANAGGASPSPLLGGDTAFSVTYRQTAVGTSPLP